MRMLTIFDYWQMAEYCRKHPKEAEEIGLRLVEDSDGDNKETFNSEEENKVEK